MAGARILHRQRPGLRRRRDQPRVRCQRSAPPDRFRPWSEHAADRRCPRIPRVPAGDVLGRSPHPGHGRHSGSPRRRAGRLSHHGRQPIALRLWGRCRRQLHRAPVGCVRPHRG